MFDIFTTLISFLYLNKTLFIWVQIKHNPSFEYYLFIYKTEIFFVLRKMGKIYDRMLVLKSFESFDIYPYLPLLSTCSNFVCVIISYSQLYE